MVFYYLEALDGGTTAVEEARKYQNEMLNDIKFDHHNIYGSKLFYDLIVEGKGAGRLLNVRHCRDEEKILAEVVNNNLSPQIVKGIFEPAANGAGEMRLFNPMSWNNISIHVRYGRTYQNSLNEQLHEHKLEGPIGFTPLRPHVLSNYVKDNSANEHFEMHNIISKIKMNEQAESKTNNQKNTEKSIENFNVLFLKFVINFTCKLLMIIDNMIFLYNLSIAELKC